VVEEAQSIPVQLLDLMEYMSCLQLEDDYLDICSCFRHSGLSVEER